MIRRQLLQSFWVFSLLGAMTSASSEQVTARAREFAVTGTAVLSSDLVHGQLTGVGPVLSEEIVFKDQYSNRFLRFDGLSVWLVRPIDHSTPWVLAQVQVRKGGPEAKFGLSPGASRSAVRKALGKPGRIQGRYWTYFGESTQVRFEFRGGVVHEIFWNLHVG